MTARKVSLAQQYEAVSFALTRQSALARGGSIKGLRGKSTEEFDVERLRAVVATLDWLMANETDIKAFLRLPPEGRKAALDMAAAHPGPEAA
jgi:uncharacterized protein YcbX